MIKQLRDLNALPEGLGPTRDLTTMCESSPKVSDTLFWLLQTLHAYGT